MADIFVDGADRFGLAQADKYHDGLEAVCVSRRVSARGALATRNRPAGARAPYKAHLIVYDIEADDGIVVLRVRHGREDWQSDL